PVTPAVAAPRTPPPVAAPAPPPQPSSPPEEAPPSSSGPVTLARVREQWPLILQHLEPLSRSAWMIAMNATPVDYGDGDVLTLAFGNQADIAAFRKLANGKGPSQDLRAAIQSVLGVNVRYLTRRGGESDADRPADGGGASTPASPGSSAPSAPAAGSSAPRASSTPPAPSASRPSAAPVTEWTVAPIPAGEPGVAEASAQPGAAALADGAAGLAVDDEPEEAASALAQVLTLQRDGEVSTEPDLPADDDVPPAAAASRPVQTPRAPRTHGIERVGEAVVRQLLGATFVREEPYTPPTRFN
ncbi:MAG: DNA polymerase III subunit gamma and tau, partial [Microbacterium sp.]